MDYNFIIKYPFSNKAKEFLKSNNADLFDIRESILKKTAVFLLKTIHLDNQEKEKQWNSYKSIHDERVCDLFVKLFPVSKIFLHIIDNIPLIQSFANHYEYQLKYYLLNSKDNNDLEVHIEDLCPYLEYDVSKDLYYIKLVDLLSFNLGDDFNIVYSDLENGVISLNKRKVILLLSIILKKNIIRSINDLKIDEKDLPSLFIEYVNYIKDKVFDINSKKLQSNFDNKIYKPKIENYPPCFKALYKELISGHKLGHFANYHLAVFLVNIGYTLDEVLDVFKKAPNFDEKIASYQIQKIIDKEYSVANCETLKSNNLCVKDCKVKHPLQLFNKDKSKFDKKKDQNKNKDQNNKKDQN